MTARLVDNGVSEARDLHAAERNFLATVRLALMLLLSGGSLISQFKPTENPVGLAVTAAMLLLSLSLPVAGIWSYERTVSGTIKEEAESTRQSEILSTVLILAAIMGLVSAAYSFKKV